MTDTILGAYDLNEEIEKYPPGETAAGRRAETLIKDDRLRVVLITMRAGATLHEHTAPGPITIQVLGGQFGVTVAGEEREMGSGTLLALASGVRHAVTAREDGSFLLTIGWAPSSPTE